MRNRWIFALAVCVSLALPCFTGTVYAYEASVCGKPLTIQGYIQQEIHYGLVRDKYDVQSGLNSFLTTALLEIGYKPTNDLKLFASGYFEGDWAYEILGNSRNNQWDKKDFGGSRHHQYIRDDWNDWLHEAHVTWANEGFYLRVGKQIVQWGETDGQRLANLINPIDQRRGLTDVKFDTTVLPIWMLRAEYNTKVDTRFLTDFGVQFILDPAFKFRGNEITVLGNDEQGIFAPGVNGPTIPFLFPNGSYIGKAYTDIEKPHDFDPTYFSYGLKFRGVLSDGTIVNILGFYGRDRDYAAATSGAGAVFSFNNWDYKGILSPVQSGYYPYYKFVGLTLAKEVPQLAFQVLSNIAPVFRLESTYAFNTTYGTNEAVDASKQFVKTDELAVALTMDYKVRVRWLNPTVGITINPQVFFQREMNFNHGFATGATPFNPTRIEMSQRGSIAGALHENNYKYSLLLMTQYLNTKLTPMAMWIRDVQNATDMYLFKLTYARDSNWTYGLSGVFFSGKYAGNGMEVMRHKDKVWATVSYSFN